MPPAGPPALLSLLWSPLVVVTAAAGDDRGGQIAVSAFAASIVPERPRLLVEVQKRNHTHALIERSRAFAVHLLRDDQWRLVRHWGFVSQTEIEKFAGVDWQPNTDGIPILNDALGVLTCRVVNAMDGGDMTVYLAEVTSSERRDDGDPIRWHEVQRLIPPEWAEEYARKLARDVPDSARRMATIDYAPFTPR